MFMTYMPWRWQAKTIVRHLPKKINSTCSLFLRKGRGIYCEVTDLSWLHASISAFHLILEPNCPNTHNTRMKLCFGCNPCHANSNTVIHMATQKLSCSDMLGWNYEIIFNDGITNLFLRKFILLKMRLIFYHKNLEPYSIVMSTFVWFYHKCH